MSKPNSSWISEWNPEDETFWKSTGKSIAQRNLIWSIFAEHLGFFDLAHLEHRRNQNCRRPAFTTRPINCFSS